MIVKTFTAQILCICSLIMQTVILKKKNGNKYFIFYDYVNENKKVLKKYNEVWDGIKNQIEAINRLHEN